MITSRNGTGHLSILIGLALMAVALPVASLLASRSQDNRNMAAGGTGSVPTLGIRPPGQTVLPTSNVKPPVPTTIPGTCKCAFGYYYGSGCNKIGQKCPVKPRVN